MIEARTLFPAGDLNRLRQINEQAVLEIIRSAGELRLAEIAERAGLARASAGEVVRGLQAKGWVAEEEPVATGRGRPAHRYRFRAEAGNVVGLDIGAYTIRAAVADLRGDLRGEAVRLPAPATPAGERLAMAREAVLECLATAGIAEDDVWVTAVASTGTLDLDGAVLACAAIPDWRGVNLVERLTGRVPGVVMAENDVRLATLAEQRLGAARGVRDVIVVQAGRRVGLGIVIDGQLRRGHGGVAGDLSRFSALSCEHAIGHLDECVAVPRGGATGDQTRDVLAAAGEGRPEAVAAFTRYSRVVAEAVASTVSIVDPEMVVLTGTMAARADLMLPVLEAEMDLRCMRTPRVVASSFGSDAVTLGAVWHALGYLADRLLGSEDTPVQPLRSPAV
ncbi:ROK family protein [Nonomuraea sp. NPDC050536]|uniref:ROK family transcriptional regulator n=1 Tax=Nonomuraea sp. NPDC050536 TaxID=3364366 RepID=UPI0037CABD6D